MIRQYVRSDVPPGYVRARRLFLEVPICIAVVLSMIWLGPHFVLALKENLQSNPDGWRGVLPLVVIMGAASFLVVLACAAAAAVLGFALQVLFARRITARSARVT